MKELSDARETFGVETTLSGKTYFHHFQRLKRIGYRLVLVFLWLLTMMTPQRVGSCSV